METKNEKMKFIDLCRIRNIVTMPITVTFSDSTKRFSNGEVKKNKLIKSWDIHGKVTNEQVRSDNKGYDQKKIDKRWESYNNGNPENYNMFMWDTSGDYKAIDIDSILPLEVDGKPNIFVELQEQLPVKKSTTKSFGRHLLCKFPNDIDNKCPKFPIRFGEDVQIQGTGGPNKKPGVELCNGQSAWAKMEDDISEGDVTLTKEQFNILIGALKESVTTAPKKLIIKKTKAPIIQFDQAPTIEFKPLEDLSYKYATIQANIIDYCEKNPDDGCQNMAAVCISAGISKDEKVYEIVLNIMKKIKKIERK